MMIRYRCVIYNKVNNVLDRSQSRSEWFHIAGDVSYSRRTGRERLHQFLTAIVMSISDGVRSKS